MDNKINDMLSINPYLNFPGNTEEAFNFYRLVFGGEFITFQRFAGAPGCDQIPEADANKVMHVALPIGNSLLMGTDAVESMGHTLSMGNNISIAISPDSEDQGKKFFEGLAAGGTVTMPYEKAPWGAVFGMCIDKFGIQWMVNYDGK